MGKKYILTYKCGARSGKLIEPYASSIDDAIKIVKAYYGHIYKTGEVTKKTEKEAIIKAFAPDPDNHGNMFHFTYTLREVQTKQR